MAVVSMKQLLEAGVHFGHQTRRWNPKMKPYIYTERNGIHIIDLQKTVGALDRAYNYVQDVTRNGGRVLFVGTKKQAQEAIAEEAARAGQYYVNQRWLGGLLTNFKTIEQRLKRLEELEQMRESGTLERLPKKEQLKLNDERVKLNRILGGIRGMRRLPEALFIIDTKKEHIAIHEARRLDIPVVALVDTNADPDEVTYPIPANDDAIRAVRLLSAKMAEAASQGAQERASSQAKEEAEEGFEPNAFENYTFEPEGYNAGIDSENTGEETATVAVAAPVETEAAPLTESADQPAPAEQPEAVTQPNEAVEVASLETGVPSIPELADVPSLEVAAPGAIGETDIVAENETNGAEQE